MFFVDTHQYLVLNEDTYRSAASAFVCILGETIFRESISIAQRRNRVNGPFMDRHELA